LSWEVGGFSRPRRGEAEGGDCFFHRSRGEEHLVAVVDVLGHGSRASEVAVAIRSELQLVTEKPLPEIFQAVAAAAAPRGCALFLGLLKNSEVHYVMVGDIRGWLLEETGRVGLLRRQPGVVGRQRVIPVWQRVTAGGGTWLVICTDGVKQIFSPRPDRLARYGPARAARQVALEWGMDHDDVTVVVCRRES
jgi:hypothetical protein